MSDDLTAGGPGEDAAGSVVPAGSGDWPTPGEAQAAAPDAPVAGFGGGPVQYAPPPTWTPPPGGAVPPPPGRPPGDRGGRRPPPAQGWVVALIVIGLVGVILVLGWIAVSWAQRAERADRGLDPFLTESYPSTTWVAGSPVGAPPGGVAPPVVPPPVDAAPATAEIAELYRRIFTPTSSRELWEADFTDPTGLRPLMEGFGSGSCAPGTVAVVTGVQFTSDDTADVEFRFEGPNVPDIGRTYLFGGGAAREPGGPWKATPQAVHEVVNLAAGYCG